MRMSGISRMRNASWKKRTLIQRSMTTASEQRQTRMARCVTRFMIDTHHPAMSAA